MAELTPIIKESFLQFSGAVLQSRALVDVRDCIKPSARQIFYCMYTDKFIHSKPFQKTLKAIGSSFRMYIHGDSSVEGIIMRAAQPFAYRYPLVEVEGSYGTLLSSKSWAAPRYTSSRLSPLAEYLFKDINKDTISEWRENYDETEKYPAVLPSKGFFNIVNGAYGIGVGASSSIPTYNLRELNEALIKLLWNPNINFDDIYCAPDFPTGAILLNADEVKESHRSGNGKACKLRSVVEWDEKERCLIVTEIPYMVYTETICKELEEIINSGINYGIERFNDLTGKTPLIKIYLSKNARPEKVIKYLYKNTSLESYYGINFTMLEKGRFPKLFTWKEILQSHLNHEKEVYINGFKFDLNKINQRLHIIDGLLKAINMINQTIDTIKTSKDSQDASINIQKLLSIDEIQAKAILEIKLARLAKLEINKLENEKVELLNKKGNIENILSNEDLLKKEIENGLREVINKFSDERRTKVLNLSFNDEDEEPIEEKSLIVHLTNLGNLYTYETTTLMTQKRGGRGAKVKLNNNEYIINTINSLNINNCLAFSNLGKVYSIPLAELSINSKINVSEFLKLNPEEKITRIISIQKFCDKKYIIFITKNGLIKKSELNNYNIKKTIGVNAIKLKENDSVVKVLLVDKEEVGFLTKKGYCLIINTDLINPVGRVAAGVIGMKLSPEDEVIDADIISNDVKEVIEISKKGLIIRAPISEMEVRNRGTKGIKIHDLEKNDTAAALKFRALEEKVTIISNNSFIKIKINDIPIHSKGTKGIKSKELKENEIITNILLEN